MLTVLQGAIKEACEERLPIPSQVATANAEGLLSEVHRILPSRLEVYPTPDGEIAIDAVTGRGSSVILLCDSEGGTLCLANLPSCHRRGSFKFTASLPDNFLREALSEL